MGFPLWGYPTPHPEREEEAMTHKRNRFHVFETELDRLFYVAWGRDPFDMLDAMVAQGYAYTYAFATIQRIIDNLWEHYLESLEKEKEALQRALDAECPWQIPGPQGSPT